VSYPDDTNRHHYEITIDREDGAQEELADPWTVSCYGDNGCYEAAGFAATEQAAKLLAVEHLRAHLAGEIPTDRPGPAPVLQAIPSTYTAEQVDLLGALQQSLDRARALRKASPTRRRSRPTDEDLWCAECGTRDAESYWVTFTGPARENRTEVCADCDAKLAAGS
jgi:hypothetical protein